MRHIEIGDDEVDVVPLEGLQRLRAVRGERHLIPGLGELCGRQLAHDRIVIHEEDAGLFPHAGEVLGHGPLKFLN